MSLPQKDSIHAPAYRARFLVLVILFSLFLSGLGLGLGERILRSERLASVRKVNAWNVRSLASEAGVFFQSAADRLRILGTRPADELAERVREDADLVSVTVYAPTSRADYWEPTASALNPEFSKLYGFSPKSLERLRRAIPIPFARVVAGGPWLVSAAADADAPLATLAVPAGGETVVVADVRTERWAKRVSGEESAIDGTQLFLVDGRGNALAHPDLRTFARKFADGVPPLAALPLVMHATADGAPGFLSEFFDWEGRGWTGAIADAGFAGVRAVSQISEDAAFAGVERFRRHAALLALLGVTLALFGAGWWVRQPLHAVASAEAPPNPGSPAAPASPWEIEPFSSAADEFQELLAGFRGRVDQIRTHALEPVENAVDDPEKLRQALAECGKNLESLGEQSSWASQIFKKLRKVGTSAVLPESGESAESADH